jgi:hypothetical protein
MEAIMGGKRKAPAGKRTAPENWIEREVTVGTDFGGGPYIGVLEEVNDRGVVLRYEMEGAAGERPMFVPWSQVLWMYPVDEQPGTSSQDAG